MNQQRYERICQLFEQCSQLPADQQESFIRQQCGEDDALYSELIAMLECDRSDRMAVSDTDHVGWEAQASKPIVPGYELLDILGYGGMGTVWRALHLGTSRQVALKIVDAGSLHSPRARARFDREVQLCAKLKHPNIARVYDNGVAAGFAYYSMELVDGDGIDRYADRYDLDRMTRVRLMAVVCAAVEHAHQRGVIHRDLKPSNILVTDTGTPLIVDFGLAKGVLDDETDKTVSVAGEILGTPAYMAPEQAAGLNEQVDTRSDVYSLGVILFEIITGQTPHDMTGSVSSVLRRIATEEIRRPRDVQRGIERDLEAVLYKALAREPRDRYGSAGELSADLERFLAGQPVAARVPSPLYVFSKWVRANSMWASLWGIILVGSLVAAAVILVTTKRHEREAQRLAATAEQQRHVAERERIKSEHLTYASGIQLVAEEIGNYRFRRAQAHLRTLPDSLRGWEWYFLMGQASRADAAFWSSEKISQPVRSLRFSADGRYLAASVAASTTRTTEDADILLLDAHNGRLLRRLEGHTDGVFGVAFTPDGGQLISGGRDRTLRRWDVESGRLLETVQPTVEVEGEQQSLFVFDILVSRDFIAYSGNPAGLFLYQRPPDGTEISLQDVVRDARLVVSLPGERGQIAMDPLQKHLVWITLTWFQDLGYMYVVDLEQGEVRHRHVQPPGNPFTRLDISPLGDQILTSRFDGSAQVWDLETQRMVHDVLGAQGVLSGAFFLKDARRVAMIARDDLVRIWDLTRGATVNAFFGARNPKGGTLAVSDDRTMMASLDGVDQVIRCWRLDQVSDETNQILSHKGKVRDSAVSPDGRYVASVGEDGQLYVYDLASRALHWSNDAGKPYGTAVTFSRDGQQVVIGRSENPNTSERPWGELRFFELATGRESRPPVVIDKWVWDIEFDATGNNLAVAVGAPGKVVEERASEALVYDMVRDRVRQRVATLGTRCRGVAFSDNGRSLVTASEIEVAVWDIATGDLLAARQAEDGRNFVRIHDGAIVTGNKGVIEFLEYPSLKLRRAFGQARDYNDPLSLTNVSDVSFTADGRRMVSAAWDHTLTIWDCENGQPIWTFLAHRAGIHHVQFSADGAAIVSSGHDGAVKLWSLPDRDTVRAGGREIGRQSAARGLDLLSPPLSFHRPKEVDTIDVHVVSDAT